MGLGGGGQEPSRTPDPCAARAPSAGGDPVATLERLALNALAGSACELGVSRERLLLSLAGQGRLDVEDERRTEAFRTGLRRAIDEEERAGRLDPAQAFLLRQGVEALPIDAVLEQLLGG